jgi:small neutral amino acid transporter SnatA (MarC family)
MEYPEDGMNSFAVVIALAAVAALSWLLTACARRILRRHGVWTDERPPDDEDQP